MLRYFPSCNFTKASPDTAKKIRDYLSEQMPVAGCCIYDKTVFTPDDRAVYFCQACRERLQDRVTMLSLWEYLDERDDFPLPDYGGVEMNLQDCWRDRNEPQIHKAVRSLLRKMNIRVVEIDEREERSLYCGDLHFEPQKTENIRLMAENADKRIYEMDDETQHELMREQVEKFSCEWIICDCNSCKRGILKGGGKAVHLLELVMGDFTDTVK